jgi:plasmid stabilization system protein ParE
LKPLKIIRSEETIRDVADIHLFIAMSNSAAADRFLDALLLSFRTLAQWPEVGPRYQSNCAGLSEMRFWHQKELTGCIMGVIMPPKSG